MKLSEQQRLAAQTVGKNICVSAGAGSGKTRVLVERFLYLVREHGISPGRILAITFTEKAANEMKRRIVERLREEKLEAARREVENAAIGTVHSFAARLLREHPIEAGVDPAFMILEAEETAALKERVLDATLETLASEPSLFDLLRIYGERSVKEGVLDSYQRSRNSERSFKEILESRTQADRNILERQLRERLKKIEGVNGAAEIEVAFEPDADRLMSLKSKLRAAGKQKEAIRQVQESLEVFAGFLREEQSLDVRSVFVKLALQFEEGYEARKRELRALDFDDLQIRAIRLLGSEQAASKILRKHYQEKFQEILVDEFQDTNRLQDLLLELIRRPSNLFVVGDFKQSIYGFRGTKVEIFLEKEKAFAQSKIGTRISLAENYRSRPELIDFVNQFFEILWREDPIPFEKLVAIRPPEGARPRVERLGLEKEEKETLEELRIREARSLALHIRSLVESEGFRYRDIACLFEAMTPVHFYEQAFRRAEIPYFVVSNRGFYTQPEIRDIVSFLLVLENPRRDIPLAAALRSPLFQISDETLFWLAREAKQKKKETPLAEGLRDFESIPDLGESEKGKLRFFKETLQALLREKEKQRISELIEGILRRTQYDLYVLKLAHGERRFANLRKLVEIAREMESKEPLHLGDFVRAVKELETREVRESQAQIEAEEGEVVKLMTIHMAKGLEFPVVILPDLGRGERQETGNFLVSEEGFGIRVRNPKTLKLEETLTFRRNRERLERLRSEESKRLLYVGMTRAEERLILSGPVGKGEDKDSFHEMATWADWVERILGERKMPVGRICEAPAEPFPFEKRKALAERKSIRSRLERLEPIRIKQIPGEVDSILQQLTVPERAYFERIDLPVSAYLLFSQAPEEYFRVYEIGASSQIEIKEEGAFPEEEGMTSADFGTCVHGILEQVFRHKLRGKSVDALVSRLTQDLEKGVREEIHQMVERFIQSDPAKEIQKSKQVYPEHPFVLRLPHGLIHGKIDLIYQTAGGDWILLDYKTSQVDEKSLEAKGEEYRVQMELYALAFWQILKVTPREARILFLRIGQSHSIPFAPDAFEGLNQKYCEMQKRILKFRKKGSVTESPLVVKL